MPEFDTPFDLASNRPGFSISTSHPLCSKCQGILSDAQAEFLQPSQGYKEYKGDHHESVRHLIDSVRGGCKLCAIIWARLRTEDQQQPSLGPIRWSTAALGSGDGITLKLKETVIWVHVTKEFPFQRPLPESCHAANTGTESCLRMARLWLSTCVNSHEACVRTKTASWLPSRLVHVGSSNPPTDPRLCLRNEVPPHSHYLTLSHCWGQQLRLKLTGATFDQFRQRIPPAAFPKTYLDALHVARSLGYEYLWIDSICIIQDSKEDWRNECSTMGLVYKNGACNIAAMAGKDGSRGCFSDRGVVFFQPLVLKTKKLDEVEHWSITAEDELMCYRMKPAWDSPLYSRGWVLQEWFLAPRILHFARHQIFWECSRGTASEAYPDLEDRDVIADMHHAGRSQKHALDFSVWSSIVYAYSSTSLTKATDKLPAVSAIAKEMGQRFGFDDGSAVSYLAGVWSFCLVQQLMWSVRDCRKTTRAVGRAPSWSWASIDGPIRAPSCSEELEVHALVDIIHCETFPLGPDVFQEVTGGMVRVRGWLWKIAISKGDFDLHRGRYAFVLPWEMTDCLLELQVLLDILGTNDGEEQFLLPVIADTAQSLSDSDYRLSIKGLLLLKTKARPGQFIRIGEFQLSGESMPIVPHRALQAYLRNGLRPLALQAIRWADEWLRNFGARKPDVGDYEECAKHLDFRTRSTPVLGECMYTISIV